MSPGQRLDRLRAYAIAALPVVATYYERLVTVEIVSEAWEVAEAMLDMEIEVADRLRDEQNGTTDERTNR